MNAFAATHNHQQLEKRGRVQQREASASRTSTDDASARFATVVLPHLDDAYAFAVWLAGNPVDAEHVVEAACLHAYRAIDSFAGGNARVWVLIIVRHCAHLRSAKDRTTSNAIVGGTEFMDPAPSTAGHTHIETRESPLASATDPLRVHAALAGLPMPFREAVVLREIHGLNYREIAEVTEVPIGTVMSRLAYARSCLVAEISGGQW